MKLSKIYKDKKKGIHVCYSGSHYGAPADSKLDTDKRAELGPVDGDTLSVKQGEVTETWPLIGSYTGAEKKEKPKPAAKPADDKKDEGEASPTEGTAEGDKTPKKKAKKAAARKRSNVQWKEGQEPKATEGDAPAQGDQPASGGDEPAAT